MAINSFILWNYGTKKKMGARRCWLEAKCSSLHNFTAARSSALDFQYKKVVVVMGGLPRSTTPAMVFGLEGEEEEVRQ